MSHLTYAQRKKFLSEPFFILDLLEQLCPDQQPMGLPKEFNPDFAKEGKDIYRPIFVEKVRKILSEDRVFTLQEVVDLLDVSTRPDILKGKIRKTIQYLEYERYVCYLPDTNGQLTFCNYKHYETIKLS